MGFTYAYNPITRRNSLCCDFCDAIGAKKMRCPVGWCQPYATCNKCAKLGKHKRVNDNHNSCRKQSAEYHESKKKEAELIASGRFLRCSALTHGDKVKVIFRGQAGERAYFMAHATYDAIPLMTPATMEDYQKFGLLEACKSLDIMEAA